MRCRSFAISVALHGAPFAVLWLLSSLTGADIPSAPALTPAGRLVAVVKTNPVALRPPAAAPVAPSPPSAASVELVEIGQGVRREFLPESMGHIFTAADHWGAKLQVADFPLPAGNVLPVLFCNPEQFPQLRGRYRPGQIVTYEFPEAFQQELDRQARAWATARGLQGEIKIVRAVFIPQTYPFFAISHVFSSENEPGACSGD